MRRFVVCAIVGVGALSLVLPAGAKVSGRSGWIAFSRFSPSVGDTITYIVRADGHGLRPVFKGHQAGLSRWSPHSGRLAMQVGFNNPCPPCGASTVIFNPLTGRDRILSPPEPHQLSTQCSIWSPDEKHFACEVNSNNGRRNGIYTIRTSDGGGFRRVLADPGADDIPIDYSPNGKYILFGRNGSSDTCKQGALYVIGVNGRGLRRITPRRMCDDDGSWSPNGKTIIFGWYGSLYSVRPNGKDLRQIIPRQRGRILYANAFDVGWSPHGKKIVFSMALPTASGSFRGGKEGIATANPDGTGVKFVTHSPTVDSKADWGTFRP